MKLNGTIMKQTNKNRDVSESPFCSFSSFTQEMYNGDEPCGVGHQLVSGGYADRWTVWFGNGETARGNVLFASINQGRKISIFICGNVLHLLDIRYSGKTDFWEYSSDGGNVMPGAPCCDERSRHKLEPEKIEAILNAEASDSVFYKLVMARAREIYEAAHGQI